LILAAVGQLQFEVVQARLENEYNVESSLEPMGYDIARWADGGWEAVDKADKDGKLFGIMIVQDRYVIQMHAITMTFSRFFSHLLHSTKLLTTVDGRDPCYYLEMSGRLRASNKKNPI